MSKISTRLPLVGLSASIFVLSLGCASQKGGQSPAKGPGVSGRKIAGSPGQSGRKGPAHLQPSEALTPMLSGSQGPYLAGHGGAFLAVFGAPKGGGNLLWQAKAVNPEQQPAGEKPTPWVEGPKGKGNLLSLSVRGLAETFFVVVWSRKTEKGYVVEAWPVDAAGKSLGAVREIWRGVEKVLWAEALPTRSGAHVLVAREAANRAEILAAHINKGGSLTAPARVVVGNALSWDGASGPEGGVLAAVVAPPDKGDTGNVVWLPLGAAGQASTPQNLWTAGDAEADVDVQWVAGRAVIGFTRRQKPDSKLMLATVSAGRSGNGAKVLQKAKAPLQTGGSQALVSLSSSGTSILVQWQDPNVRPANGSQFGLAALSADGFRTTGTGELVMAGGEGAFPSMVGHSGGFTALTMGTLCKVKPRRSSGAAAACEPGEVGPSLVGFDRNLALTGGAALMPTHLEGKTPAMAWNLTCTKGRCTTLAATGEKVPSALAVSARTAPSAHKPLGRGRALKKQALKKSEVLASGFRFAGHQAFAFPTGMVLASLSAHSSAAPPSELPNDVNSRAERQKDRSYQRTKKGSPRGAWVQVRRFDKQGKPESLKTITVRADRTGGLSGAFSQDRKESVMGWTAMDNGVRQLFLTKLSKQGKKRGQSMFTQGKANVLSSALLPTSDGWLVAWVEEAPKGGSKVMVGRVRRTLQRVGTPRQLHIDAAGARDLAILPLKGGKALVVFNGHKAAGAPRVPFSAVVDGKSAKPLATAAPLPGIKGATSALRGSILAGNPQLLWRVDGGPVGLGLGIETLAIGSDGKPRGSAQRLALEPGPVGALGFGCEQAACRILMTRPQAGVARVLTGSWSPGQSKLKLQPLTSVGGGNQVELAPQFLPTGVILRTEVGSAEGRIQRWVLN